MHKWTKKVPVQQIVSCFGRGSVKVLGGSFRGYNAFYSRVLHRLGSPWCVPYRSVSGYVQETDRNASAASYLNRIENDEVPLDELDHLAHDASQRIDNLPGSTVSNVLGILVLAHYWDAEVFSKALHRSNLRTKKFGFLDQVALYHVDVAIETQLRRNIGRLVVPDSPDSSVPTEVKDFPGLPLDVMLRCRDAERQYHAKALPIYSSLHTRLRRQGLEAVYQYTISEASNPTGKEYYLAHVAVPSEKVVIIVDGEWNQIPGTNSLSLSSRIYDLNLAHLGWKVSNPSDTAFQDVLTKSNIRAGTTHGSG
eukprot:gb/GECG01000489.1/.p1 GENE.gb/GECG01000489.1/~~gb/GECG01000489.1/.p1  ORF type:complete len:309 (+),score=25.31 gb/GECG01000489.1/:1-927(+)